MWLVTQRGFYSVVEHRDDPSLLLVRARRREDLEALCELVGRAKRSVRYTRDADYPWRLVVRRERFAKAAAELVLDVDYPNFKARVADRLGSRYAWVLHSVWATLRQLEDLRKAA